MPDPRIGSRNDEPANWLTALGIAAVVGPPVVRALSAAVRRLRERPPREDARAPVEEAVAGVAAGAERARSAHAVLVDDSDSAVHAAISLARAAVEHGGDHLQEGQAGLLGEFAAIALLAGARREDVERLYASICSSGPGAPA